MVIDGEELILYKETENEALYKIIKDTLDNNGIKFKYIAQVIGVRYKRTIHQIYIREEDRAFADDCLDTDVFDDLPWDPDSYSSNPNPEIPWYLDEKRRRKVSKIFGMILAWGTIIMIIVVIYMANK